MIHVREIVDLSLMVGMLDQGYIRRTSNGDESLFIFNYTQSAQYDGVWNEATTLARGLITKDDGMVVARPFRKFFNLDQLDQLPPGQPVLDEKIDGSLGIAYTDTVGEVAIATRGSFTSEQALWATDWLYQPERREHLAWCASVIEDGVTPLFEIVYPANRIVVEYGDRAELVLIACIDIHTGCDVEDSSWPGSFAPQEALTIDELDGIDERNAEGYVLRWPDGTRAKYKFPTYKRLHKLITGVNERTIWENLASGEGVEELIELVPDEFHAWVETIVTDLRFAYSVAEESARAIAHEASTLPDRKTQAEHVIATASNPSVVFAMLDGKDHSERIWKDLKPDVGSAFWNVQKDDEAA